MKKQLNSILNEIRLALFVYILGKFLDLVPKEAKKTLLWLQAMPFDELSESKRK